MTVLLRTNNSCTTVLYVNYDRSQPSPDFSPPPNDAIYGNPYWKRDTRRSYPQPTSYTQSGLCQLIASQNVTTPRFITFSLTILFQNVLLTAPLASSAETAVATAETSNLAMALMNSNKPFYSVEHQPPVPKSFFRKYRYRPSPDGYKPAYGEYYPIYNAY